MRCWGQICFFVFSFAFLLLLVVAFLLGTDLQSDLAECPCNRENCFVLVITKGWRHLLWLLSLELSKQKHSALSLADPWPGAWEIYKQVCNRERHLFTGPMMLTEATQAHWPLPPSDISVATVRTSQGIGQWTWAKGKATFNVFSPHSISPNNC